MQTKFLCKIYTLLTRKYASISKSNRKDYSFVNGTNATGTIMTYAVYIRRARSL